MQHQPSVSLYKNNIALVIIYIYIQPYINNSSNHRLSFVIIYYIIMMSSYAVTHIADIH